MIVKAEDCEVFERSPDPMSGPFYYVIHKPSGYVIAASDKCPAILEEIYQLLQKMIDKRAVPA